ncbi:MAG: hypothetical protein JWP46_4453 [Modestobacter sp.]|jgi:hypothetical protein|nr:hypothetical protein [Modestobacter sp.]
MNGTINTARTAPSARGSFKWLRGSFKWLA